VLRGSVAMGSMADEQAAAVTRSGYQTTLRPLVQATPAIASALANVRFPLVCRCAARSRDPRPETVTPVSGIDRRRSLAHVRPRRSGRRYPVGL
jgi:hypothetical protein